MLRGRHLSFRSMAKDRVCGRAAERKFEIRLAVGIRSGAHAAVQDDVMTSHKR
jgi:hypothetical protein